MAPLERHAQIPAAQGVEVLQQADGLECDLVVAGGEWEINVVMDINQWYDTPAIYDFGDRGGIMGNADAQSTLRDNGNSVFAVGSIGRHDHDAHDHGEEEVHQQAGSDHDHDQPAGG